ncbi:hypothetical protein PN419_05610 [Halorubrum ezzemoulense]|uniref:hypothetical protein n=1 Tax=Halorubrum ezzemoulense TaxID=337243 RepID=UPI00233011B2|nr:hypothetical protein [Halorubrum ezzemoulense]MDB9248484.1 hypothetical protein [Halorubrum ezzemoulense]MDB9259178.1 hypothetical protein [Halorubrum ezzemoulense]MDB9262243.1 hypothetical protein [Halorubrum ezzemoulense]MDB9266197.1 hypothetical protein [Halorubrum ezzemoulense]MDB9269539.1 hypothetical protein [Halorubrum ezzemoulense]
MSDDDRSDGDRSDGADDRSDGADDRSDGDGAPEGDPFGGGLFDDEPTDEADEAFDAPDRDEADEAFGAPDGDETDDPFAALGGGTEGSAGPVTGSDGDATGGAPREDPEPRAPGDDPFADLDTDGTAADEDPFESMGTGEVGEEDVWEALDEEASVGTDATAFDDLGADGEVGGAATRSPGPTSDAGRAGDEHVVDKRSYCQRCPHFTAPPETACAHEGTEIVESVDFSQFRVRNCPMIDADDPAFDGE